MKLNYISLSIPLFLTFIWLEYKWSMYKQRSTHHFKESVANLNVGIAERMADLLTSGAFIFVFNWIYHHAAIFTIKASLLNWLLLFLATDFIWYWYHRCGDRVNLFWAVHVVHHQSSDFNYTSSVRITIMQAIARGFFWSVLPLLGFPPEMIITLLLIHGAYPFFTHTQLIGKLGWLEYFLVTPSHHRVHHSSNPEYLDKNYGDMLIIWDKLFGSFAQEKATPVYGLTKPLDSHSFLWQHFHFFGEILLACKRTKGLIKKARIIFGSPSLIDPSIRKFLERKMIRKKNQPPPSGYLKKAIGLQTCLTLALLFSTTLFSNYLQPLQLVLIGVFILLSVIITGAMIEQHRWVFHLEYLRLTILCFFLCYSISSIEIYYLSALVLITVSLSFKTLNNRYYTIYNYRIQ